MKPHITTFLFFILVGCSSTPLTLSPTKYTIEGKERVKQPDKSNPKLEPTVCLKDIKNSIWGRKAVVKIQGWYSSQGHQARRLKEIKWTKEIDGDQLTLIFYVQPKTGVGKENAYVNGYNYHQEVTFKIPSAVRQLNFKLIEQHATQQDILSYQSREFLPQVH
ncbi:hypothetical protein [Myroides sp. WP-1]|uniref:hypothetical protein n=1 Tax=Myroides sp. WP-1 TaxID=2759944 RepID=UPI0015FAE76D|nr:hypothetical protein [Myroides sp. WP-1]MBB1140008.1 hypothetical protein [Myroides sp. WP-1]